MTDARDALHERIKGDLGPWVSYGLIDGGPTDEEVDAVLDVYEEGGAPLSERYEDFGKSFVAAVILSFFERRDAVVTHGPRWADAERAADVLAEREGLDEETRRQPREMAEDATRRAPADYDELLGRYVGLTDGLLDDLSWDVAGDHSDDEVVVRCGRAGTEIEATLDDGDEVDVHGLVDLLNRVVAETTESNDRFTELDSWPGDVYVSFIYENYTDPLENYFSYAVGKFQQHVGAE